jgi:hypothetical protein
MDRYSKVILELSPDRFPASKVPFSLYAYRDSHQTDYCLVEVKINIEGQHWPDLGGRTVYFKVGETKREALTDPGGVASFENILISDLEKVEIGIGL